MTQFPNQPQQPSSRPGPSEQDLLDLLITRIADGAATSSDWASFESLAMRAPDAWRELARAQRDQQALSLAVGVAIHAADRIDLPTVGARVHEAEAARALGGDHRRRSRWRLSPGWAVAAILALAWAGTMLRPVTVPGDTRAAGIIPAGYMQISSPEDALQAYVDKSQQSGRFVSPYPPQIISAKPLASGEGYEVVQSRQIVERVHVLGFFRAAQDESGRAIPVRVNVSDLDPRPQ